MINLNNVPFNESLISSEDSNSKKLGNSSPPNPSDHSISLLGTYTIKQLASDIKSERQPPSVKKIVDIVAANIPLELSFAAAKRLMPPVKNNELIYIIKFSLHKSIHSYFTDLTNGISEKIEEFFNELMHSSRDFTYKIAYDISRSLCLSVGMIINLLKVTLSEKIAIECISKNNELNELSGQEYLEALRAILQTVTQLEISLFTNELRCHINTLFHSIKEGEESFPETIMLAVKEIGLDELQKHVEGCLFEKFKEVDMSMAANFVALVIKDAEYAAQDDGTLVLLEGLDQLNKNESGLAVGLLLKKLALRIASAQLDFTVSLIRRKYPETVNYIQEHRETKENLFVITAMGQNLILQLLKEKEKLINVPCFTSSLETDTQMSDKIFELALNDKKTGRLAFVRKLYRHFLPIFVEKKDARLRIYAPEGVGSYLISELTKASIPCTIFLETEAIHRQVDSVSCPVFALRDISLISQHPNLMDQLETYVSTTKNKGKENNVSVSELELAAFPPQLMKCTQSISSLEIYDQVYHTELMKDLLAKNKIISTPLLNRPKDLKDRNISILLKRLEYERIIYGSVIIGNQPSSIL